MSAPSLAMHILAALSRDKQPPRLRVSQAGSECQRQVYFAAIGAPSEPDAPKSLLKMGLGQAADKYTLRGSCFVEREGDWFFQKPVEIEIDGLKITGTADAVWCPDGKPQHVADLKVVGQYTWSRIKKEPAPHNVAQVNLYAYGLGAKTWSLCYWNANLGEILEHHGTTDETMARMDFRMFANVAEHLQRGVAPERPFDEPIKWPCDYCRFKSHCWSDVLSAEL